MDICLIDQHKRSFKEVLCDSMHSSLCRVCYFTYDMSHDSDTTDTEGLARTRRQKTLAETARQLRSHQRGSSTRESRATNQPWQTNSQVNDTTRTYRHFQFHENESGTYISCARHFSSTRQA